MSFLFSDTLGNHVLATSAQVTNRFDEFGGSAFYLNRTHRWNWGVGVDQTPYIARAFATGIRYGQRPAGAGRAGVSVSSKSIEAHPASCRTRSAPRGGWSSPEDSVSITLSEDVTARTFDQFGQQLDRRTRVDLASFPDT